MPFANLVRWSGLAAMVGGALWVVVFVLFASRPSGPGCSRLTGVSRG
jgi:hypothetical protein